DRLERSREDRPRRAELRRGGLLGRRRPPGAGPPEGARTLPLPLELGRARGDGPQPGGGRDGVRAAAAAGADRGARLRHRVPPEPGHRVADPARRERRLPHGGVDVRAALLLGLVAALSAACGPRPPGVGEAAVAGLAASEALPERFGHGRAATAEEIARL